MVLVYIDQADQQIKKSSLEAMSYGAATCKTIRLRCCSISFRNGAR